MLTVLVAAGGVGAVRIVDAARDSGLRAVTVYEPGNCRTLVADLCEDAYALDHVGVERLPVADVLAAAAATGADIVHPGYGNAARDLELAVAVTSAGLVWGGAPPALLEAIGGCATLERLRRTSARAEAGRIVGPRRLQAMSPPARRLSVLVARRRGSEAQVLATSEWRTTTTADGATARPGLVECPATGVGDDVERAVTALVDGLPDLGLTHGLITLDLDVVPGTGISLAEVRAGLQPDHAAAEEALRTDLAALELALAADAPSCTLPGPPERFAIARVLRAAPNNQPNSPAPRVRHLVLPAGPGIRCDVGTRSGDVVTAADDPLLVITSVGPDQRVAEARAARAAERLVMTGVRLATDKPWPTRGAGEPSLDAADRLLRSGAPQLAVDAALAAEAPGVRMLLLEVDRRRVRIAVHPRTLSPGRRPPRRLRADAPEATAR